MSLLALASAVRSWGPDESHRFVLTVSEGSYFVDVVESPHSFDELRSAIYGRMLKPLVQYLVDDVHYPGIVSALL